MSRTTKAAVLVEQNKPMEIWELEIPDLKPGQVLVEIHFSSICQTQINEFKGVKGPDAFLPHTMGHEASGIVLEVGPDVKKVKVGDHVVCTWMKGSGADVPSTKYKCAKTGQVVNSGAITTFMDRSVISENRLTPIPKNVPLKQAALFGCAIPTGMGAILREMDLREGSSFALFGAGGVGQSALVGAKLRKANPIIVVDIDDEKLENAKAKFGVTHTINALKADPVEEIKKITGGKGVDYALESCGLVKVMEQAFKSVRNFGGLAVIAGNCRKGQTMAIDPYDCINGKRFVGTWGGASKIDEDIDIYVTLFMRDEISSEVNALITHNDTVENINQVFETIQSGKVGRAMLSFKKD